MVGFPKIRITNRNGRRTSARDQERFYNSIAEDFEHIMNRYDLERRLERMMSALPMDLSGALALDGGCGPGFFSQELTRRGARVVSADISLKLAAIASGRASSSPTICDIASLPFANRTFDYVVSSECIEHTVLPENSFISLAQALAPGGTMVLSVPNQRWKLSLTAAELLHLRPYGGLENWVHPRNLRRWVLEAGLNVVDHFGIHPLPFQLPLARRWMPLLEQLAQPMGMWMINQVIVATR